MDNKENKRISPFESPPREMESSDNYSSPILDRTNKIEPQTPVSKKSFARSPFIKDLSENKRRKSFSDSPTKNDNDSNWLRQIKKLDISKNNNMEYENEEVISVEVSPFRKARKSLFGNSIPEIVEEKEMNLSSCKNPFGTPSPQKLQNYSMIANTSFLTPSTPQNFDLSFFKSNSTNNPRSAPQSPKGFDLDEFKIHKSNGHKRSHSHQSNNLQIIIESERDINHNPYTPPSNRTQKRREEKKIVAKSKYTTEFSEIEKLGSGEFSDVYLATNKLDGVNYAIKRINKPFEKKENSEIYTLAAMGTHPNLMRYYSSWKDEDNYIFIQLEYCSGGDLHQKIKIGERLTQKYLLNICKQMLSALEYMHKLGLVHLDVKPENIYISKMETGEDVFKLGDFGFAMSSKLKDRKDLDELYGDDHYASPEIRNCDWNYLIGKLEKSDIFSLGCTLIALTFHSTNKTIKEDISNIQNNQILNNKKYSYLNIISENKNNSENENNLNNNNLNFNNFNNNNNFIQGNNNNSYSINTFDVSYFDLLRSMVHPDVDLRLYIPDLLQNNLLISDLQRKYLRAKTKNTLLKNQIKLLTQNHSELFSKLDLLLTQQSNISDKLDQFSNHNN